MNEFEKKLSELEKNIKEIRGIYNVTFNDKQSTPIKLSEKSDIELVENAVIEEVVMYVKGYHLKRRDIGFGAKHIELHLDDNSEGQINLNELLNLGNSLRSYKQIFKEPFIDNKKAKIYEWQNDENTRFRCVIDNKNISEERAQPPRSSSEYDKVEGLNPPLSHLANDIIITFYSDRNINKRMEFKNPKVAEYYENLEKQSRKQLKITISENGEPVLSSNFAKDLKEKFTEQNTDKKDIEQ